jgi:hypothetical protein
MLCPVGGCVEGRVVSSAARAELPAPFAAAVGAALVRDLDLVVGYISEHRFQLAQVLLDVVLVPLLVRPMLEQWLLAEVALLCHVLVLQMQTHRHRLVCRVHSAATGVRTALGTRQDQVTHVMVVSLQAAHFGGRQDRQRDDGHAIPLEVE